MKKIQENVLPSKYQYLITGEINRILRELKKPANGANGANEGLDKQQQQLDRPPERTLSQTQSSSFGKSPESMINNDFFPQSSHVSLPRKASQMASDDFDFIPLKGEF